MAANDDRVTLQLGDDQILVAEGFDVRQSILQQPGEFNLRVGQGSVDRSTGGKLLASNLIRAYPPNTPFRLFVNEALRMSGVTDGYRCTDGGGATQVTFFGRDALSPLHDSHVREDLSFQDQDYESLVKHVLTKVNLDPSRLDFSNEANRKVMAGAPIRQLLPPKTLDQLIGVAGASAADEIVNATVQKALEAKVGQRWHEFLRHQLDRAGLFLWAAANGRFILSTPNVAQEPAYRIVRERGQNRNLVNVEHADFMYDTRPMFCLAYVFGRGGGRKFGRTKSIGHAQDDEMLALGFDAQRTLVIRDAHCQTEAQTAYLAARKLAEARRHGHQLVYTLSNLSTSTSANAPSAAWGAAHFPAIWTPDTVVEVRDDEFGIRGNFWIETVEMRQQPSLSTTIRLMRVEDVVFSDADFD